ncbi:MAG: hypothetical protein FJ125_01755 [Deltaproteobacteria bacterium]|nr:hypothetical protein [Deltaproteobacteria bacterium]
MSSLILRLLLVLLLCGVAAAVVLSLRRRYRFPPSVVLGPPPLSLPEERGVRWRVLFDKSARFAEALELRNRIHGLVAQQRQRRGEGVPLDDRHAELLEGVDTLLDRIAHHLSVLDQTETHLATYDAVRHGEKEEELRSRLIRAEDGDARVLLQASLNQLERQRAMRAAIRARGERLLSGVDHTIIQLQAVHLDLIDVFSAGAQSDDGQLVVLRQRLRQLAEELGRGAQENDEFARLLLEEDVVHSR